MIEEVVERFGTFVKAVIVYLSSGRKRRVSPRFSDFCERLFQVGFVPRFQVGVVPELAEGLRERERSKTGDSNLGVMGALANGAWRCQGLYRLGVGKEPCLVSG